MLFKKHYFEQHFSTFLTMTWIFCQWAISLIIELFTPQAGFLLIYNIRERVSGGMVYTFSCLRFQTEVQTGREESNKLPIYETVYSNWQYTGQWLTKWSPGPQAEPFWVLKISIRKLYRNRMESFVFSSVYKPQFQG